LSRHIAFALQVAAIIAFTAFYAWLTLRGARTKTA